MKKILLAGIGAAAITVEKSKEIVDSLIKKGELTVEQGKVINEELKRKVAENFHQNTSGQDGEALFKKLDTMSKEEIAALKAKLVEIEKKDGGKGNADPA
jgi:polyhydroxyalkanoate synthesis regulator phasin